MLKIISKIRLRANDKLTNLKNKIKIRYKYLNKKLTKKKDNPDQS